MGALMGLIMGRRGSSRVSTNLVICVSLYVNIFMGVNASNRYMIEMHRMHLLIHFALTAALSHLISYLFLMTPIIYTLKPIFLDYGLLLKWSHTTEQCAFQKWSSTHWSLEVEILPIMQLAQPLILFLDNWYWVDMLQKAKTHRLIFTTYCLFLLVYLTLSIGCDLCLQFHNTAENTTQYIYICIYIYIYVCIYIYIYI